MENHYMQQGHQKNAKIDEFWGIFAFFYFGFTGPMNDIDYVYQV